MKINQSILTGFSITAAVGLMTSASLSAATIAEYAFADGSDAATSVDANLSASVFSLGTGLTNSGISTSANAYIRASDTTTTSISVATAIASNDYFSFTVDADDGFEANLSSLTLRYGYSQGGTSFGAKDLKAYVFSSVDGFVDSGDILGSLVLTTSVFDNTTTYPGDNPNLNVALSGVQFQSIATATEFRIYLADTTSGGAYIHRIDNVTLNGEVVAAVPEPGTYALMGGLLALGWVMMRRRV